MKFIYLGDTHIGGSETGEYCQQELYLRYARDLFDKLGIWLHEYTEVDFIIHGGNMADSGTEENILLSQGLFSTLPAPVLWPWAIMIDGRNSYRKWLCIAPEFFAKNTGLQHSGEGSPLLHSDRALGTQVSLESI